MKRCSNKGYLHANKWFRLKNCHDGGSMATRWQCNISLFYFTMKCSPIPLEIVRERFHDTFKPATGPFSGFCRAIKTRWKRFSTTPHTTDGLRIRYVGFSFLLNSVGLGFRKPSCLYSIEILPPIYIHTYVRTSSRFCFGLWTIFVDDLTHTQHFHIISNTTKNRFCSHLETRRSMKVYSKYLTSTFPVPVINIHWFTNRSAVEADFL